VDLYDEFFGIVKALDTAGVRYALAGGLAMAFHDQPRFTRDIDLLVISEDAAQVFGVMSALGYFEASEPWTFENTHLTLHRYLKTAGEDHLIVDILIGDLPRHKQIVAAATEQTSSHGVVRVVRKEDLIWMKQQRASDQDKLDIRKLEHDENRDDSSPGQ
jgi:predicted nucleotidyltransferase